MEEQIEAAGFIQFVNGIHEAILVAIVQLNSWCSRLLQPARVVCDGIPARQFGEGLEVLASNDVVGAAGCVYFV